MRGRTVGRALCTGLAASVVLAACVAGFDAWLAPSDMSLWLGAWISGLCT